jgi:hypothetical protein
MDRGHHSWYPSSVNASHTTSHHGDPANIVWTAHKPRIRPSSSLYPMILVLVETVLRSIFGVFAFMALQGC